MSVMVPWLSGVSFTFTNAWCPKHSSPASAGREVRLQIVGRVGRRRLDECGEGERDKEGKRKKTIKLYKTSKEAHTHAPSSNFVLHVLHATSVFTQLGPPVQATVGEGGEKKMEGEQKR
mmetsp:Transcript_7291/g.11452  ORF Transcript_7291/g.11452 Transcript_7291/m.11452 type:complete len:119 (+) Transcript_7291:352-708(+)